MARPTLDLGSMGGTPEDLLEKMQSLTETFSAMLGKEFALVNAPSGSTDCETFFRVPLADPEAYIILEHEISHPFAGTDLPLTKAMLAKSVDLILTHAGLTRSNPDAAPYLRKLDAIVHHLWNVLEDWRCCSVWNEIYPGGAQLLRQRWHDIAEHEMQERAEKDLVTYLMRVAAGVETPTAPAEFQACAKHMKKARSRVELVDHKACLALTHQLIRDIADELVKQFPPPSPNMTHRQQMRQSLTLLNQAISSNRDHDDDEDNSLGENDLEDFLLPNGQPRKIRGPEQQLIMQLLCADDAEMADEDGNAIPSPLQKLLDDGSEEMFNVIQAAMRELAKVSAGEEKGEESALLKAAKVSGIEAKIVVPSRKLPKPTRGAARMRRYLENVKMRKETRRVWDGGDLDIEAYITAKISNRLQETKLFREERKYGGMDLLLLVDVSGSMHGAGIDMVEQAIANVDFACRGVKVKLHVWAFSSELYFFKKVGSPKEVPGVTMAMTHMTQALDAAWEWAKKRKTDRAVLLITDGFPSACRGRKSSGNVTQDLHDVLRMMRLDGIVVSVLGIGSENRHYYDTAFGEGRYGLVAQIPDLSDALEESARVMIETHLGR